MRKVVRKPRNLLAELTKRKAKELKHFNNSKYGILSNRSTFHSTARSKCDGKAFRTFFKDRPQSREKLNNTVSEATND